MIIAVGMLVGGVGLLILAIVFLVIGINHMGKLAQYEKTQTYTAQQLAALHSRGGLLKQCEVTGVVECDSPMIAPMSEKQSAIYTQDIVREREQEYEVYDDDEGMYGTGGRRKEKRLVRERLPDEDQRQLFWVRDQTGRVLVDPAGATLKLEQATRRYEKSSGWEISGTRTIGHQYTEYVLEIGKPAYVLGWAADKQGRLMVARHPTDKKQGFFISDRSEAELTQSATIWSIVGFAVAIVAGFGGLLLLWFGLLQSGIM